MPIEPSENTSSSYQLKQTIQRVWSPFRTLGRSFKLCDGLRDVAVYCRCRMAVTAGSSMQLRLRNVPAPLWCRPGTSDAAALWGTFGDRFHLPPMALRKDAVILDLGANVGYTAVDFAVRYPCARIIAVELDAANIAVARQNLAAFGSRCTVVHAAVWSSDGEVEYAGDEAWAFHVVQHQSAVRYSKTAPARTMVSLLAEFALAHVDFVKMDIEGAEREIITPAASWLSAVQALVVEVHPPATVEDCAAALEKSGFVVNRHARHPNGLVARRSRQRWHE